MPFYNKGQNIVGVTNAADPSVPINSVFPLWVTEVGGNFVVQAPLTQLVQVALLAAPPAGQVYAIKLIMSDGAPFYLVDQATKVVGYCPPGDCRVLEGQICHGAVTVEGNSAAGGTAYVTYDIITRTPNIH